MNEYDKKKLRRVDKLSRGLGLCSGAFLTVATVFMTINILTRTIFRFNLLFIFDLCGLCAAGVASFAVAYCTFQHGHSTMDTIIAKLPRRKRAVSESVAGVISLVILAFAIYASFLTAVDATKVFESTTTSNMPTWVFRWIYLAGLVLCFVACILEMIDNFRIAAGQEVIKDDDELKEYQKKIEEKTEAASAKNGSSSEKKGEDE